ncbi:MAG: hypothetical protein ACREOE_16525, partial [Gemmatimonadales bacterium]
EETAWDAGGGGFSLWEYSPAWQSPFVAASTVGKGVPDVAMDADFLVSPAGFVSGGGDTSNGGTSLASPLSLGSWARLESAHDNTLGYAGPVLYALATPGLPFSTITGMTDITLGTNGIYQATPGWDFTTGLGSFDIVAVSALVGQTGGGALSPCTVPGTLVVSQKPGSQTGAPANEEDDITGISFAEPYTSATAPPALTITMSVGNLSALPALPPNTFWIVYFSYQGQTYFVDMDTSGVPSAGSPTGGTSVTPEFVYGVQSADAAGGTLNTTLGPIQGTYSTANNTITWVMPESLVMPPICTTTGCTAGSGTTTLGPGSRLAVHGETVVLVGALGTGLLETIDTTPTGTYTLVGNAACNPAAPVTTVLTAIPSSGPAPLT